MPCQPVGTKTTVRKFMQANMNGCQDAYLLFPWLTQKVGAGLLFISEPYKKITSVRTTYLTNSRKTSALRGGDPRVSILIERTIR